jgi:ATP-dependent Clp protease, protease subunit
VGTVHVPYPGLPQPPKPNQPSPPPGWPQRRLPGHVVVPDPQPADPYQRLYRDRIVFLGRPLDDATANDVVAQLLDLDSNGTDLEITLQINSVGGSYSAMLAVYDTMRYIGNTVRTMCIGQADGPAAVLLASGEEGRRFVLPTAHVVLRQPSVDQVSTDVETELEKVTWQREQVERILTERTVRSREEIQRDIDRPTPLTAEQAVEYGIADRIAQSRR